jgi:hypothetical protein
MNAKNAKSVVVPLEAPEIVILSTKIEEAARSNKEGVRYFIEPAQGTLRRATSKRHHIIFGRRGSGKSSLLRKAGADLTVDRRPIAYINLESFKDHSYPDILLSVLIATFREFKEWLDTAAVHLATRVSFWKRLFGTTPSRPAFNRADSAALSAILQKQIAGLEEQLHAPDQANLKTTSTAEQNVQESAEAGGHLSSPALSVSAKVASTESSKNAQQVQQEFSVNKVQFLHRHIMDYQRIFSDMAKLSGGDSFLFLDDLYQINRADQPRLIDYFHRIAKDHNLWLKIGTIRHRTDWYIHGNPPIGLKLGDDADEIDLDLTLEKYDLAKNFLFKILNTFAHEAGIALNSFVTEGARERLVLASGGVARDFLSIFRRSIDIARERHGGHRGESIGVEDVNVAAGEHDTTKREEFKRDTSGDDKQLDAEFNNVRTFCLEKAKANCFLFRQDAADDHAHLIRELVDLRLLHVVRSRVTVKKGHTGRVYEAYMLDVSQYAGARKHRGLAIIEFWKPEGQEFLRRASLLYEPAKTPHE